MNSQVNIEPEHYVSLFNLLSVVIILKLFVSSYMYMFWSYLPLKTLSHFPSSQPAFLPNQSLSYYFLVYLFFNDPLSLNRVASMSVGVELFTGAWVIGQ